jgi:predicted TIM-barrel fold metal-dependent hydrolase
MDRIGSIDYRREPTGLGYVDDAPLGAMEPKERIERLDLENIERAFLYPTLGVLWIAECDDEELTQAYLRAYNRWIVDFCARDVHRLVPIAHISLLDPEGAVEEAQRARKAGCAGVYLSPDPASRGGRQFDDRRLARFWQTVQELDMPIAFHVVARADSMLAPWLGGGGEEDRRNDLAMPIGQTIFAFTFLALDVMAAFTSMMTRGLFEIYPRLRLAVLEAGSNWITAWLDRLDHKFEVMRSLSSLKLRPSEYFARQCVISAEPDESITDKIVERLGADYFVWASDYPHIDASFNVVGEIRERIGSLPVASQRKVLGENAIRFYGITPPSAAPHAS